MNSGVAGQAKIAMNHPKNCGMELDHLFVSITAPSSEC